MMIRPIRRYTNSHADADLGFGRSHRQNQQGQGSDYDFAKHGVDSCFEWFVLVSP
jgi:hypothetical protein